jgi:predicted phosphodiesterase
MKIRLLSDLHLNHQSFLFPKAGEDLLVLAGDIATHTDSIEVAKELAVTYDIPVIVVAGNHEFYQDEHHTGHIWETTCFDLARAAHHSDIIETGKVTFLENSTATYKGVRFIGATLWTDMQLFVHAPWGQIIIRQQMNDYNDIYNDFKRPILPRDTIDRHIESRIYIKDTLAVPHEGPTVVITHHAPSWLSVHEKYKEDLVSAAYASRLEGLILDTKPTLWLHGHTHTAFDYTIGDTRVVCNPRGYPREYDFNNGFNANLLIEINENDKITNTDSSTDGQMAQHSGDDSGGEPSGEHTGTD